MHIILVVFYEKLLVYAANIEGIKVYQSFTALIWSHTIFFTLHACMAFNSRVYGAREWARNLAWTRLTISEPRTNNWIQFVAISPQQKCFLPHGGSKLPCVVAASRKMKLLRPWFACISRLKPGAYMIALNFATGAMREIRRLSAIISLSPFKIKQQSDEARLRIRNKTLCRERVQKSYFRRHLYPVVQLCK